MVPAGTGVAYYRQVKIAGEDVVEGPIQEPVLDAIPRLRRGDAPAVCLPEDTGEESLAE